MHIYSESFYANQSDGSFRSAMAVLPELFGIVGVPSSVVDIGCGVGTWAAAATACGVKTVVGLDGAYVPKNNLHIPKECFFDCDLNIKIKSFEKKFDMGICLEVAEHLSEARADKFIEELTLCSETILFSAAIPGQGGESHINEQWQSYWINKFNKNGYFIEFDLRPLIWINPHIEFWYRQNIFYFSKKDSYNSAAMLDIVHPEMYQRKTKRYEEALLNGKRSIFKKLMEYFR